MGYVGVCDLLLEQLYSGTITTMKMTTKTTTIENDDDDGDIESRSPALVAGYRRKRTLDN